jgi:hypothetical protein
LGGAVGTGGFAAASHQVASHSKPELLAGLGVSLFLGPDNEFEKTKKLF